MTTVPDAEPQPGHVLRYDGVAATLHWVTAALLLTQIYVGFTFHDMARGPARMEWFAWHKTLGVAILLLALARLGWRLMHKPPPFPPELPRWERLAAVWNHRAFYFVLIALPVTGLLAVSGGKSDATTGLIGGLRFPLVPGISENGGEAMGGLHEALVLITIALLVLHVAAALKHLLGDRTRASGRMPPFPQREG